MNPVISVVIPSIGRDTLFRVLSGLEKQTLQPAQYEVIVVFDGAYPDAEKRLHETTYSFQVRSVSQERAGAASARNRGAMEAKAPLLVFLDDDIQPDNDLLRTHHHFHTNTARGALAFGHVVVDQKSENSFLKHHIVRSHQIFFDSFKNGKNEGPYFFCSANFSMEKQSYADFGGFDPAFRGYGWEEADFGVRAKGQGVPITYLPAAIGKEFYVKRPADTYKNAREKGANEVRFIRKHPQFRPYSDLRKAFCGNLAVRSFIRIAWGYPGLARFLSSLIPAGKLRFRVRYVEEFWKGVKSTGLSWAELQNSFAKTVLGLAYHDIVSRRHLRATYDVRVSLFRKQIQFLAQRGYHPVTIQDFFDWREQGKPLPEKPIFLTVDDGYKSFYSEIAPVLKEKHFKAILFVCPEAVGMENFWDQQRGARKKLLMDWTEIGAVSTDFEIGSHGMTHLNLNDAGPNQMQREVCVSKEEITNRVKRPEAFSYPFGVVPGSAPDMVRNAGYRCAFTADPGPNCIGTDPYRLKRIMVRSWDFVPLFFLKLKLAGLRKH